MNKKLIIIIAAAVLVLGGGAGAFFFLSGKKTAAPDKKEAKAHGEVPEEAKKEEGGGHGEEKKEEGGHGEAKEEKAAAPEVSKEDFASKGEESAGSDEFTYRFEPTVVNIFDKNSIHYLKLGLLVFCSSNDVVEELKSKKPQIHDKLLFILSDVSMREVLTSGGKALIKEDLIDAFNKVLKKGKVHKIYFTDFTVQ